MITTFDNLIVVCKQSITTKIAKRTVMIFEKGKLYHCVFIENEYRVYSDEFILHIRTKQFNEYFKRIKNGKKVALDEPRNVSKKRVEKLQ